MAITLDQLKGKCQSINLSDGTNDLVIAADGSISINSTDLDIRDLDASQDNVAISDGTNSLSVNADGSINVQSFEGAYASWKATDDDVTSTAAELAATPLSGRLRMIIQNLGDEDVYLGTTAGVTTATGLLLPCGSSVEMAWDDGADVFAVTAAGTSDVRIAEFAA